MSLNPLERRGGVRTIQAVLNPEMISLNPLERRGGVRTLDTMNLRDLKGTDEWKVKATLSNQLLEGLREQVAQLETGPDGAVIVEGLTVEAFHRRVDDAPADASDLAAAMSQVPQFTLRKA